MLYPKYIGKNENIFYCPDAATHPLLAKDASRTPNGAKTYPWSNWGRTWTYGSYEYRPRYGQDKISGRLQWAGLQTDFRTGPASIAADGFSGDWHSFGGSYPVHTSVTEKPGMLYYNVAFVDGSGKAVRDSIQASPTAPAGKEFRSRAGPLGQLDPYIAADRGGGTIQLSPEYTSVFPNAANANPLLPPANSSGQDLADRKKALAGRHIDRVWLYFDKR